MNEEDFKESFKDILGIGWQTKLAKILEVKNSTVSRWVSGAVPIPGYVNAYYTACAERQKARGVLVFMKQEIRRENWWQLPEEGHDGMLDMKSKLPFPGVESLKNFPSIQHSDSFAKLSGDKDDSVLEEYDYIITRHPDKHHFNAYLDLAKRYDLSVSTARSTNHYYTLIATNGNGVITRQIATHAGVLRTTKAHVSNPRKIIEFNLQDLI